MAAVFVALVGLQPAAVAVALATWNAIQSLPVRVVLLATPRVEAQAARLRLWWRERAGGEAEILPISSDLQAREGREPAHDVVAGLLAGAPADREVIFAGDPGLNFLVAAIARHLPWQTTYLHTDDERLHVRRAENGREIWDAHPLQDLGFDALLALHGLGFEVTDRDGARLPLDVGETVKAVEEKVPGLSDRLRFGVTFQGVDVPRADLAYEARGRLHLLLVLESSQSPVVKAIVDQLDSQSGDPVKQALLQAVREAARFPQALGALRPRVAVWATQRSVADHARASGLEVFTGGTSGRRNLGQWLRTRSAMPGHQLLDVSEDEGVPALRAAGPGEGPDLVVCLGADPLATLTSLASHRPRRAWILHDHRTPVVRVRARRLRDHLPVLGVGEAEFVPTDLQGRGIAEWARVAGDAIRHARVDISPGSKAQTCALARTGAGQLWSLLANRGLAMPLLDAGLPALRLRSPGLVVVAAVTGGGLEDRGEDMATVATDRRQFLDVLTEYCGCLLQEGGRLPRISERHHSGRCEHGRHALGRARLATNGEPPQVTVTHGDRTVTGALPLEGGFWLEPVVGRLMALAGADEVRVGMKWSWPPEIRRHLQTVLRDHGQARARVPHRVELDVAARFGHRLVAASCKSYMPRNLGIGRREVEAVALGGLGRFALPVLVVPSMPEDRDLLATRGAPVFPLADVLKPPVLRERLDQAFRSRSTLADA